MEPDTRGVFALESLRRGQMLKAEKVLGKMV
jgi:hypothetical protein